MTQSGQSWSLPLQLPRLKFLPRRSEIAKLIHRQRHGRERERIERFSDHLLKIIRRGHADRDVWHEFFAARVRHIMSHVVNRWLVYVGVFRRGKERSSSPRLDGKGGNCINKFLLELDELVSRLDQDHGHTGLIPGDVVVFERL